MTTGIDPSNRQGRGIGKTDRDPPAPSRQEDSAVHLTEFQRKRVADVAQAMLVKGPAPTVDLDLKDNNLTIRVAGYDADIATLLQMADMGTSDSDFHAGLLGQVSILGSKGRKVDGQNSSFVLAVVRSVKPRDELEAMLATQMGAIHSATMMMARRLNHVETIAQQDAAERALNKLARTFTMQMEALKRYRTGGQQRVTVEHVTVNAGGQAIVGAVETGGGGRK
jgi:hypothetical protein